MSKWAGLESSAYFLHRSSAPLDRSSNWKQEVVETDWSYHGEELLTDWARNHYPERCPEMLDSLNKHSSNKHPRRDGFCPCFKDTVKFEMIKLDYIE